MKTILFYACRGWLGGLVMIGLFAGCSATQETNKLIIYSPHGKELLGTCKKLFEAKHPGVTVEWLDLASQEVLDRIRSEARNPQADLWWGAPATLFTHAAEEGLLAKYRPSWAAHVTADQHDANDFWYGTFVTPEIIMYNDSLLKAAEVPQDWDDLLKPAWKHRIVCREPMASGTIRTIFSAMIDRQMQGPGGEKAGFDWLRRFDGQISEYATSSTMMYQWLSDAETPVTIWNMADVVLQSKTHHYPFSYVWPRSGAIMLTDGIAVVKGAKHPVLAQEFYEFVTTLAMLLQLANELYRMPARTDLPVDKLPDWLQQIPKNQLPVNWKRLAANENRWMKAWQNSVKGKQQ